MNLERVIAVRNSKTVYRDQDKAIKVFDKDYSKADVLNEALNQSLVEETGLNVPKVIEVTTIDGKWAIVSDYIKGKTMAQLMEENPSDKSKYIEMLVDIQLELHSKKALRLSRLKDKMNKKIIMADVDATIRYELHTRLESMPKHNKLCHGDLNPSNIIITPEGVPYILDWSHATQGNASADTARTYLLFYLTGDIEGAKEYLELFCKKSGIDKKYIQRWLPIVAASQSVKGKPQEREFLLSWVNIVDFE